MRRRIAPGKFSLFILAFGACHGNLPTCANPCTNAGDTRCADNAHAQICTQQTPTCLQWGPSQACDAGAVCASGVCTDECQVDPALAACNAAAAQITSCCGPTFGAGELCHTAIAAGHDPVSDCNAQASATCATLHTSAKAQGVCCCQSGQTCDYQTSDWQCAQKCTSNADCASSADRPSCAPNLDPASAVCSSPYLCKPMDAILYDGCSDSEPCTTGKCYADSNANLFCASPCVVDGDCGNVSEACCVLVDAHQAVASGSKACAPCTISGAR